MEESNTCGSGVIPVEPGGLRHPLALSQDWLPLTEKVVTGWFTNSYLEVIMQPVPVETLGEVSDEIFAITENASDPLAALMPLLEQWAVEDPQIAAYVKTWVSKAFDKHGLTPEGGKVAMGVAIPAYVVYRAMRLHFEKTLDPNRN